ncbi:Zinc finger protein [Lachnellula suecica]|uniref:Zinc finger protein n=1 Tax=Lachnellula suecica TaxID=602035 RepID=A0A8T9BUF9_9HELO|nr:Zinc finger protein [Lachnellula suecica]
MSEPPHQIEVDFDYWMNMDLVDACFDPMHDGMGLDRNRKPAPFGVRLNTLQSPIASSLPASFEKELDPAFGLDNTFSDIFEQSVPKSDEKALMNTTQDVAQTEVQNTSKEFVPTCHTCGFRWDFTYQLDRHAKATKHLAWPCLSTACNRSFISSRERDAHQQTPHTNGHGRTITLTPFDCVECSESLSSKADLLRHSKETQHQPYSCECGALFSRLDVLNRHLDSLGTEEPKYPCTYCRRHRGMNGFRRRDHLNQHIRNYHHLEIDEGSAESSASRLTFFFPVCTHVECPHYRDESFKTLPRSTQDARKPFQSRGAYTTHMRNEHNECPFPCDIQGCDRVGRRGYFREKDMIKHRREAHPDSSPYQVSAREMKYHCPAPDCNSVLDPSSLQYHNCLWNEKKWEPKDNIMNESSEILLDGEE